MQNDGSVLAQSRHSESIVARMVAVKSLHVHPCLQRFSILSVGVNVRVNDCPTLCVSSATESRVCPALSLYGSWRGSSPNMTVNWVSRCLTNLFFTFLKTMSQFMTVVAKKPRILCALTIVTCGSQRRPALNQNLICYL